MGGKPLGGNGGGKLSQTYIDFFAINYFSIVWLSAIGLLDAGSERLAVGRPGEGLFQQGSVHRVHSAKPDHDTRKSGVRNYQRNACLMPKSRHELNNFLPFQLHHLLLHRQLCGFHPHPGHRGRDHRLLRLDNVFPRLRVNPVQQSRGLC